MANPQREDGHIDIANELMDHLIRIRIPGEERQIFDVIMRQTWGYCELKNGKPYKDEKNNWVKKKYDSISNTQFEKFTGIKRRKVWSIINKLLEKNLITKNSDSLICKYGIQKNWEKWKVSPKKVTVTNNGDRVSPNMVTKVSPNMVHTKEKKEIYTKEKKISFNFKTNLFNNLTIEQMEEYEKKYPDIDVYEEEKKMTDWLIGEKVKKDKGQSNNIPKNFSRFINNWLRRSK